MKYAIIGTGKTGGKVLDMLPKKDVVIACDINTEPTLENTKDADVVIVFVPGNAMAGLFPLLLKMKKPMVIGTTGYTWPEDLDKTLKATGTPWIVSSNYSIGLNVMNYFARQIKTALNNLLPEKVSLGIFEKHHTSKLDSPSGTALFLARSMGFPAKDIEAVREGDAKGTHTIFFHLPYDEISITHEAHDRNAFAEGVIMACDKVGKLPAGLHSFESLANQLIENSMKEFN
ncbi:MAG: dihydrodipicolinate reductase C-terminal domain-containing protein [Alphaproteobacteria bacterium]|nr:dihydrodipicolinate reductase C-terminal domain-containing protein [Alphaproteobacteria bacterium]